MEAALPEETWNLITEEKELYALTSSYKISRNVVTVIRG